MTFKPLLLFAVALTCLTAAAEKNDDETEGNDTHVLVVLADGDTIDGYIRSDLKTGLKNLFSKTGSIRQYINIGEKPKGGDTRRFNASEVKEYRFLEATEAYPEGAVCVSELINAPGMFRPNNCVRGFAWELDRRESGSVLRWDVFESTGGRNSQSRLVPAVGIKLKGAKAAFGIMVNGRFFDSYLMNYLKKQCPELKKAWDEYYHKCDDAKAHRKELTDNVSTALLFYEDYLRTHEPIKDDEINN